MDEKVRKKKFKFNRSNNFMGVPANNEKDLGHHLEEEADTEKKRKHMDKKNKCRIDEVFNLNKVVEENCTGIAAQGQDRSSVGDVTCMRNGEEYNKSNRKKKKRKGIDNDDHGKKIKKKEKAKEKEKLTNKSNDDNRALSKSDEGDQGTKIRKKAKGKEKLTKSDEGYPHLSKINMEDAVEHDSFTEGDDQGLNQTWKSTMERKRKEGKRVKFSDQVEVFNDGLVQGKRFTHEEDAKLKEAIYSYIRSHGLGDIDQGLDMILHCASYPKIRGCWKEIASALPHRPLESVYHRGHILFERDENRKWTPEEIEIIRKFHKKHGSNWKMLADAMGKHRLHLKDQWRRIKLGDMNKGNWSQEEYQKLFDLVNADLILRALEDNRKYKHGMLRDNICWEVIGDKVATRNSQTCCAKWYEKLTSRMVADGEWADTDDYRLINALYTLDACCMEEVEWDHLLEHRSGDLCRKRWNQMVQHIGEHGNKSFAELVEILSKRYRPDLVEAREAFDSLPVVP